MRYPGRGLLLVFLGSLCLVAAEGCNRRSTASNRVTVRLNEVMSRNASVEVPDASGRPIVQDWVELYNDGASRVSLAGFGLTDDLDRPDRFVFPPGASIGPGEFLIVYLVDPESCAEDCEIDRDACLAAAGDEVEAAIECELAYDECVDGCSPHGLVAGFGLSATAETGERVYLFAPDERQIVDRIGVFQQPQDVANGRYPDGRGKIGVIYAPTPLAPNPPTDVAPPRIRSVTGTNPDEAAPGVLRIVVEADAPEDEEIAAALGPVDVVVQYVMFEPGAGVTCPPPAEIAEDLVYTRVPATFLEEASGVAPRDDANGDPFEMAVRVLTYTVDLPPAACGTLYCYEVIARDAAGTARRPSGAQTCVAASTLNVNEYQPLNQKIALESVTADGVPRDTTRPDWLELYNFGGEPIADIGRYMLIGRNGCAAGEATQAEHSLDALRGLRDDDGELIPLPPIEPGGFLWILADNDGGAGRRSYFRASDPEKRYFSARFALDPSRDAGNPDGFCLLSPFGQLVEEVVLAFGAMPPEPDQAVIRFPDGEGPLSAITNCPTPEGPNLVACELPPRFLDPVPITFAGERPRCPPAGAEVTVSAQVNFDADTTLAEAQVDLFVSVDGGAPAFVPLELTLAADQTSADPAMLLYDVVGTIPGQAAGSLVVFSFEAVDLRLDRERPPELEGEPVDVHDETTAPEVSFRYLVGFEPASDGPRLSEVLPGVSVDSEFMEFAEISNPSDAPLDLAGFFLTQATSVADPLGLARRWRFPEGSVIDPGGRLLVFFSPPPPPAPGEDPLGPPEYIHVDAFNLSCRDPEALFLVAPDDPARGANCVLDAIEWDLRTVLGCKEDVSVGLLCDGTVAELSLPSPGEENVPPTLAGDSFHEAIPVGGRGGCVTDGTTFLQLTSIVNVDSGLVGALGPRGSIASAVFLVERGAGIEEFAATVAASPLPTCRPPLGVTACFEPQPGFSAVGLGFLLTGTLRPLVTYRVQVTDICGNEVEMGPFSVGSTDVEHPAIRINEANRAAPAAGGEAGRSWVELVNTGPTEVDLGGMFLSDRPFEARKAELPAGTTLPAGGYQVFFLDDLGLSFDPPVPPPPPPGQEEPVPDPIGRLVLSDSLERGTCLLDEFPFDFTGLDEETSVGRRPDGDGAIGTLEVATPGASNEAATFVRGDVNADGSVNVADMVGELNALFRVDDFVITCEDAFDANDDGRIDLTDPTYIGNALFRIGPPIPPPFPVSGPDPTPDDLGCEQPR